MPKIRAKMPKTAGVKLVKNAFRGDATLSCCPNINLEGYTLNSSSSNKVDKS